MHKVSDVVLCSAMSVHKHVTTSVFSLEGAASVSDVSMSVHKHVTIPVSFH